MERSKVDTKIRTLDGLTIARAYLHGIAILNNKTKDGKRRASEKYTSGKNEVDQERKNPTKALIFISPEIAVGIFWSLLYEVVLYKIFLC